MTVRLTTYAKQLAGTGNLKKNHVVELAKKAASDGKIAGTERDELQAVKDRMGDRMTRGAKEALNNLLGNIPDRRTRRVDPEKVRDLIDSDPRLAWRPSRSEAGGGEGPSTSYTPPPVASYSGGEGPSTSRTVYEPTYTRSGGGE